MEPGHSLKIEHSITCEQTDLSSLIAKGEDALLALRKDSMDSEQTAFEIVVAAANQWEKQAAYTQNLNRAIEYLRTRRSVTVITSGRKMAAIGMGRKSATVFTVCRAVYGKIPNTTVKQKKVCRLPGM